jgi:cell shape-determining protein MreD
MRALAALLALGFAALAAQGALAALLPAALAPDLGLLLVLSASVAAPTVPAMLLASAVGYGTDLLSGTLLGEHALLRLLEFAATRFVSAQFHLERGLPLATFCLAIGCLDALGLAAVSALFSGASPLGLDALPAAGVRAAVGAALVRGVHRVVSGVLALLVEPDARKREVRFDTRRPVL